MGGPPAEPGADGDPLGQLAEVVVVERGAGRAPEHQVLAEGAVRPSVTEHETLSGRTGPVGAQGGDQRPADREAPEVEVGAGTGVRVRPSAASMRTALA